MAALGEAAYKYLWYDELVTVGVAGFPSLREIIAFFNGGKDTTSATCALLDHFALKLPVSPELSARLPFLGAFLLVIVFVYLFMRRRYPAAYALSTGILLIVSAELRDLAVEARGYALLMAGTALALFCWQTATQKTHNRLPSLLGLWFGLALAVNAHSFGILLMIPFALAEGVRAVQRRRLDLPVWSALLLFPLGLAPVIHGQRLAARAYGGNFWSQPQAGFLLWPYKVLLTGTSTFFLGVVFLYALWVGRYRVQRIARAEEHAQEGGFTLAEWVLVVALALLPLYALPFSFMVHVYRTLYVVEFALGFWMVITALFAEQGARSLHAGVSLFLVLLVYGLGVVARPVAHGLGALRHPNQVHTRLADSFNGKPWVGVLRHSNLPIVAGDHLTYVQLKYYGVPQITDRLTILTNLSEVRLTPASETAQKNMLLFGSALGYRTLDVSPYLAAHRHFLVIAKPDVGVWIADYLFNKEIQGEATFALLGPVYLKDEVNNTVDDFDVQIQQGSQAVTKEQVVR